MLRKIIAGVLSVVLLSSNFAMAASEDQQKVSDSVAPIENVEFVRDDSIPQAYSIDVPNCSYAELSKAIAEGNITQTLPGDIPIYDEELLWNFDIPDMEEPIDITRRESNGVIAITYITAEDYVCACMSIQQSGRFVKSGFACAVRRICPPRCGSAAYRRAAKPTESAASPGDAFAMAYRRGPVWGRCFAVCGGAQPRANE